MSAADTSELKDLYRELIVDHARQPRNFGELASATHQADGINPLCGDKLTLWFEVDDEDQIVAARFAGSGCAISLASASLLTECVTDLLKGEALTASQTTIARLTGQGPAEPAVDAKLMALEGVKEYPARVKCATLAWRALQSALQGATQPASTE